MPDQKSPQEKKRLSLEKDRRNTYGENAKSSRKNIPRSKKIGQMRVRRQVQQELEAATGPAAAVDPDQVGARVAEAYIESARKRFRKHPDQPLGAVLERKSQNHERQAGR